MLFLCIKTMVNAQYFEGILQLRKPNQEVERYIRNTIKKQDNVFIAKEEKVRNGIDFYISSQHFLQNLGKKLQNNFGGTLKVSKKAHTRDRLRSRDLYRVNVLFVPTEFKKNDIVAIDEKMIKVYEIRKQLKGINIKTWKNVSIDYKDRKYEILEKYITEVIKVYPNIEVLHPETFQNVNVNNPRQLKIGQKVEVVLKDGIWVI